MGLPIAWSGLGAVWGSGFRVPSSGCFPLSPLLLSVGSSSCLLAYSKPTPCGRCTIKWGSDFPVPKKGRVRAAWCSTTNKLCHGMFASYGDTDKKHVISKITYQIYCLLFALDAHVFSHHGYGRGIKAQGIGPGPISMMGIDG